MAGIYIHIPFCKQKCYYCDFYKTVNTSLQQQFLLALKEEAKVRKNYLQNETVETIYFGGGTPSVLNPLEIEEIIQLIYREFNVSNQAEITLEANPDDLTLGYLSGIKSAGINRLSIGIQSLQNGHLTKMNRRHTAKQAIEAIQMAAQKGFSNLSVDLIYGLPGLSSNEWKESLTQVFSLPVQHLSAYHLTYHEGTAFYTWLKKGTIKELKEHDSVEQFNTLVNLSAENGFEQYEISNFAKNHLYSQHNTAYWMGKKYLGLGPSAHSFDVKSRRWNVSHIHTYINAIAQNKSYFEKEILSEKDKFNEYILTRIRTKWGVSLAHIRKNFGEEKEKYLMQQIEKFLKAKTVRIENEVLTLSREGLFISDEIMTELIII